MSLEHRDAPHSTRSAAPPPESDACAACHKRRAEFCDLCAPCEDAQHRLAKRGGAKPWTAEALEVLRAHMLRQEPVVSEEREGGK